jgi:hypothetical protein
MEPKLPETKKYLASENIFTTLTIIEEPQKDQFLTNDHVIIKNETQCSICDAFFDPSDTATFATHWPQKPCTITKLNITDHQQDFFKLKNGIFAIHLTQQCIATTSGKDIFIYQVNDPSIQPQKIRLSIYPQDMEYSPNGSFLAAYTVARIVVVDPTTETFRYIAAEENTRFENALFHPHSSVLAAISNHYKKKFFTINYWDIKKQPQQIYSLTYSTQPLVAQMSLDLPDNHSNCDVHFSPDGTKLIIAPIDKKCIILNVPFEVIYEDITKEKLLYLLFLINNIKPQIDCEIPRDVTQLIAKTLLTTYKR